MTKEKVSFEQIEQFLEGRDPQKYIVAIEAAYHKNEVYLVVNDPERGKRIETHTYKPFVWMKHEVSEYMFMGNRSSLKKALSKYNLKIKQLRVADDEGNVPKRMADGFKYLLECTDGSYNNILRFTEEAFAHMKKYEDDDKVNLYSQRIIPETKGTDFETDIRGLFVALPPQEQFLVSTGKRLFKGMDDYNDVHRMQFDLETEGLEASVHAIFQIGIKDNRGFERVLEVKGDTPQEKRDSERMAIIEFFAIIEEMRPDIITAYNSEFFDWPYLERRCERLGIEIDEIAKTLNPKSKFRRKPSRLKVGSETLDYDQTLMWGYNILDISHTVRKTMAINSNIKSWSLKYITKFSNVAKKNRVYVEGDKIHSTWADTDEYWFNNTDGSYGLLKDVGDEGIPEGSEIVKGDYIVQRYLLDDLWETEQVDGIYNQAAYLVAKLLPTSYMRSSTMGTAGQWKLIMAAWSYEKGLGVPALEKKRDFTGGLSRLLEVGYARKVDKFDYAALYPKTQLTWKIFPELDISGVMEGLLTYIVDTRDEFKFKAGKSKARYKELQAILDERDDLTPEVIEKTKKAITKHKRLASDYDKKQLPLKILANSFFGAYGAPYLFNWGDSDCAEETTCRGRQSLRLMVREFKAKYNFRPLVGDTDGFNFARPDSVNDYTYIPTGDHWKTDGDGGKTLKGVDAVLAEFNETWMEGRMGLDLDDVCEATINFARKNYANDIDGKIKLVGNTVKSNKMPIYIEEFLDKGIRLLLDGNGYDFINYYYDYIDKIYNYQIPLVKIASKAKVKKSIDAYKIHVQGKNKAGNSNPRQAHMELVIQEGERVSLGDVVYYVNVGQTKSTGDLQTITDKETGTKTIKLNCKLIPRDQIEKNPDMTTDEYNAARYVSAFNKRIKPLLVCFAKEIREREEEITRGKYKGQTKTVDNILIEVVKVKDPETKKTRLELETRHEFTEKQCTLVAGQPFDESDQDSYEALMTMEDKEIRFWTSVNKLPNFMEQEEWDGIVEDYHERMRIAKEEGIKDQKERLDAIFQTLEVSDLEDVTTYGVLPPVILAVGDIHKEEDGSFWIRSRQWDVNLCEFDSIWTYEETAKERDIFYKTNGIFNDKDKFEQWLDHRDKEEFMVGASGTTETHTVESEEKTIVVVVNSEEEATEVAKEIMDNQQEQHMVTKWMEENGWTKWEGNSFIKQEWMDNNQPYDRMAIPYAAALKMFNNRDGKSEWAEAVSDHKREVKEEKKDDEFNF